MEFLGVAWHDTPDAMRAFVDRYGLEFPQAVDEDDSIFARFGLFYQPAWAFVNADGEVRVVAEALSDGALRAELDALAG